MDLIRNLIQEIEVLKSQKNFKGALDLLQENILNYNNDYRLYEEIADIYLYEGQIWKAKKAIDFALNINWESATGNYLKWFILLSNNKFDDAIKYLSKSNKLMPNNAEVLRNLWWAYSMIWESEKWIFILKRALNLSPEDRLISEDLAMALIWIWKLKEWNFLLEKIWKRTVQI